MSGGEPEQAVLLGVDVGGTFTDAVLLARGGMYRSKVPTTADQSEAVIEAALMTLGSAGLEPGDVAYFAHGMTTATNALLERKGVRTASLSTAGFKDILEIGRQNRPRLYDACPQRPLPLVPGELRFTASERMDAHGVVEDLTEAGIDTVVAEIATAAPESVAVCLLFSFVDPSHEIRLGERLRAEYPGMHVSLSSEVLPQFREYERFSTTAVDAYLTPVVDLYLRVLGQKAAAAGLPEPDIMQSNGGVLPLGKAAESAAPLLLSGPAAGVVGAVYAGSRAQVGDLIAFDMGGTSTDVSLVRHGSVSATTAAEIGGCPVALPMVDIHTIGAGGGSIAWIDDGGALRVGPESAGSIPGPACYGNGGDEATVTDASLCLGYLGGSLGGESGLSLEADRAWVVVDRLAASLDMTREEAALGVRRVANAGMVKALRVISVERGHDPRDLTLVAFGGAGPMHAADLAEELDMRKVLVPESCGVLSALGMVVGDQRRDWVRTVYGECGWDETLLEEAFTGLEEAASRELPSSKHTSEADVRYAGQSHELTVPVERPVRRAQVTQVFEDAHEQAYGYRSRDEEVELVNIRLTARVPLEKSHIAGDRGVAGQPGKRPLWFKGCWTESDVWQRGEIGRSTVPGPAVIEEDEATTVVPPGWQAHLDETGNLWMVMS